MKRVFFVMFLFFFLAFVVAEVYDIDNINDRAALIEHVNSASQDQNYIVLIIYFNILLFIFLFSLLFVFIAKKAGQSYYGLAFIPIFGPLFVMYRCSRKYRFFWYLIFFFLFVLIFFFLVPNLFCSGEGCLFIFPFFVFSVFSLTGSILIASIFWSFEMFEYFGYSGWFSLFITFFIPVYIVMCLMIVLKSENV